MRTAMTAFLLTIGASLRPWAVHWHTCELEGADELVPGWLAWPLWLALVAAALKTVL